MLPKFRQLADLDAGGKMWGCSTILMHLALLVGASVFLQKRVELIYPFLYADFCRFCRAASSRVSWTW